MCKGPVFLVEHSLIDVRPKPFEDAECPRNNRRMLVRQRTFELMDGKVSLEEIAHRLAAEFPERFPSWQQALSFVGVLSQEFSC
jgi:hypothetical protein